MDVGVSELRRVSSALFVLNSGASSLLSAAGMSVCGLLPLSELSGAVLSFKVAGGQREPQCKHKSPGNECVMGREAEAAECSPAPDVLCVLTSIYSHLCVPGNACQRTHTGPHPSPRPVPSSLKSSRGIQKADSASFSSSTVKHKHRGRNLLLWLV